MLYSCTHMTTVVVKGLSTSPTHQDVVDVSVCRQTRIMCDLYDSMSATSLRCLLSCDWLELTVCTYRIIRRECGMWISPPIRPPIHDQFLRGREDRDLSFEAVARVWNCVDVGACYQTVQSRPHKY